MREIKFRGKRKDNGEWVCGDLIHDTNGNPYICGCFNSNYQEIETIMKLTPVDPETVGQYTGRKDKEEQEGYIGDILDVPNSHAPKAVIRYGNYGKPGDIEEKYHVGFYVDFGRDKNGEDRWTFRKELGYWLPKSRIIGNIHDNSELLQ